MTRRSRVPSGFHGALHFARAAAVIIAVALAVAPGSKGPRAADRRAVQPARAPQNAEDFVWATFPGKYVRDGDRWLPVEQRLTDEPVYAIADIGPIPVRDWADFEEAQRTHQREEDAWREQGRSAMVPRPPDPRSPPQSLAYLDGLRDSNLVRGARLRLVELTGRKILIVPTKRTARSVETIELLQQRVREWSARQRPPQNDEVDLREAAALLTDVQAARLLAATFVPTIGAKAARVGYAEDLTTFAEGGYDYLLLIDVNFSADIDRFLAAQDMAIPPGRPANAVKAFEGSLSWVLLDREFDVVRADLHARIPFRYAVDSDYGASDREWGKNLLDGYVIRPREGRREAWRSREIRAAFRNAESGIRAILGSPYVSSYDDACTSTRAPVLKRIDYGLDLDDVGSYRLLSSTGHVSCVQFRLGMRGDLKRNGLSPTLQRWIPPK